MSDMEHAIEEAAASFELEGFEISDEVVELAEKLYSGEISYYDYCSKILVTKHLDNVVFNGA